MASNYTQLVQEEEDKTGGASPPMSLSPALSSSPMLLLRSVDSTFTPVSMDSDAYTDHDAEYKLDTTHNVQDTAVPPTDATDANAVYLTQSVTATARATAASSSRLTKSDYDLLSPSSGAVDAASSEPSSPITNLDNTRSGFDQQKTAIALSNSTHDSSSPKATTAHISDSTFQSVLATVPAEGSNCIPPPTVVVKPKPLIRTASTKGVKIIHPSPTVRSRSSSHTSNIAQLEATAEKLSMTSSIEDAIRDLHEEQKRSDSRRSSLLAISAGLTPDYKEPFPFARQVSGASSILDTNNAARHGGYSPAGYVMSPNNSLLSNPSRLRSASTTRSDVDTTDLLTRNGPGKSSTRSAKSVNKPSLTDIAEMEPTGLTLAAMDEADRLEERQEEDEVMPVPHTGDLDLTPNADEAKTDSRDYWGEATAEIKASQEKENESPISPTGSAGTFEQAEMAFADFDGAHCSPEGDEDPFEPPFALDLSLQMPVEQPGRPRISKPTNPTVRPKSYMDPESGQQMMYYPARVPMMLNLPQKLSKNPKAAVRNQRRSQVLSAMPEANRQSAAWLPEVLPEPRFNPLGDESSLNIAPDAPRPESAHEDAIAPEQGTPEEAPSHVRPNPRPVNTEARKSRMSVLDPADKRKSRMSYTMDNLPPQLRASAFFDMPSESPKIELKDGSAMATLDSILDASAKAPVSAFTDHAFAGKLGNEIYGTDKRKSHVKRNSVGDALEVKEVKKRNSIFHLRAPSKISIMSTSKDDKRSALSSPKTPGHLDAESDDEHTKLSGSVDGEPIGEGDEEEDEDNEEGQESDYDPAIHGPPTTLLAELQIRKRQQKLRTMAPTQLYPNGMHSTLLEIDTVAELERKNRKGKKINLAWEGANAAESDDEDVPLGLLAVKKNGKGDVHTLFAEMNRPLGLMEQRAMEDNEPLSNRRNRLQGRPTLPPRKSLMALNGGGALSMSGGLGPPSPGLRIQTPEEDEHEGETLGERMRRLRARDDANNPLPRARPVSAAFSTELLGQLGDTLTDGHVSETSGQGKAKEEITPPEEEETLGQRRRRLQAEREARDSEMGAGGGLQLPDAPALTKRHSMADVLGATRRTVLTDPRADAERAKREEAARFKRSQEQKMAGFRAQVPTNVSTPNLQRSGGYMAGQFNDGTAGRTGGVMTMQNNSNVRVSSAQHMPMNSAMGGGMMGNGAYGMGGVGGYNAVPNSVYGPNMLGYNGMPMQQMLPMPMQQPGQQYDRVDRWRQSIVP